VHGYNGAPPTREVPLLPGKYPGYVVPRERVQPDEVVAVHRENIEAGADVITTNSYGVIRGDLAKEGIESRFEELNRTAGKLARQAVGESGRPVQIAGSLPPLNGSYRPDLVLPFDVIAPQYAEQAAALADYVDLFLCETMSHSIEARAAASAVSTMGKPFIVSFTLDDREPAVLRSGEALADAIAAVAEYQPVGIMVNCCPPERIGEAMQQLVGQGFEIVGGYANVFTDVPNNWTLEGDQPTATGLEMRRDLDAKHYAKFVERWLEAGANLVGGCCGTTVEHTIALRHLIDDR
ncbi:MAG: homocysteine S-methyltransferase family protein, partial [Pseudomonadales bacterium]|nr:homocysteine S-methyltransferase family protein [Pseudomonadales bacterium]